MEVCNSPFVFKERSSMGFLYIQGWYEEKSSFEIKKGVACHIILVYFDNKCGL